MQLSELRTRVRYNIREATANIWSDAELTAHINLAQKYVAQRLNPKYLTTLVTRANLLFTAVANKDLPTTFMKPFGNPWTSAGYVYPLLTLEEASTYVGHTGDADSLFASRRFSWIQDNDLYKSNATTETLTLPFIKFPTDLSGDSDTSNIDDGFVDLLVLKASADALIKTRQLNESNLLIKECMQRIESLNGAK